MSRSAASIPAPEDSEHREETFEDRLARGWEDLIHRLSR
jgi:hypothetical protein